MKLKPKGKKSPKHRTFESPLTWSFGSKWPIVFSSTRRRDPALPELSACRSLSGAPAGRPARLGGLDHDVGGMCFDSVGVLAGMIQRYGQRINVGTLDLHSGYLRTEDDGIRPNGTFMGSNAYESGGKRIAIPASGVRI